MLCYVDCPVVEDNSKDLSAFIFVLKMKALGTFETSVTTYQSLRWNIPKGLNFQQMRWDPPMLHRDVMPTL